MAELNVEPIQWPRRLAGDDVSCAFYFSRVSPSAQANSLSSSFPLLAFR